MGWKPIKTPRDLVLNHYAENKEQAAHYPRDYSWNSKHTH